MPPKPTEPKEALVKVPPKAEQLSEQARPLVIKANNFQITDEKAKVRALEAVQDLKGISRSITETFFDPLKKIKDAYDALRGLRDKFSKPVDTAIEIYRTKISTWETEQAAIRRKAEQAQEEARQKAEQEAEDKRRKLEAAGRMKAAANVVAREVPAVPAPPPPRKVEGSTMRTDWKFEVVDETKIPEEYWIRSLDTVKIGRVVKALKQDTNIPGVRAYSVETPVFGSRF